MVCFQQKVGKICSNPQYFFEVMPMLIQRQQYLEKLIKKQNNGRVKIITGLRRCGKSFLLFELYANYLREQGVEEDQLMERYREDRQNDFIVCAGLTAGALFCPACTFSVDEDNVSRKLTGWAFSLAM